MNMTDEIMLTSLALGELQGDEKRRAEDLVASDLNAKSFLDDMVGLSAELKAKMSEESAPVLDAARRAVIEKVTGTAISKPGFFGDLRPLAVAAGMILAISGAISFAGGGSAPSEESSDAAKEVATMDSNRPALTVFEYRQQHQSVPKDAASKALAFDQVSIELVDKLKSGDLMDGSRIPHAEVTATRDRSKVIDLFKAGMGSFKGAALEQAKADSQDLHAGLGIPSVGTTLLFIPGRDASKTTHPQSGAFAPAGSGSPGPGGSTPGGGGITAPGSSGRVNFGFVSTGGSGSVRGQAKSGAKSVKLKSIGMGGGAGGYYAGRYSGKKNPNRGVAAKPASKTVFHDALAERVRKKKKPAVKFFRGDRSLIAHNKSLSPGADELIAKKSASAKKERELEAELDALRFRLDETRKADGAGESYAAIRENDFSLVGVSPLSTIGLDVDTASYANIRRHLNSGSWPPRDAVRVDEMVNYFHYDDPQPESGEPLRVHAEVASCPWNLENRLLRIGFRAKTIARDARGPSNLVFLIDVSGSMKSADKLPLLIRGLKAMVNQLGEDDRVAIVTYAGSSGLVLPATRGHEKNVILAALDRLAAKGSTNGASGIELAYTTASENFDLEGTNRVILCTDGDFNVGVSDTNSLIKMIKKKAKTGIFLSVLGFGTGNIKDDKMEALANKGNGHYAYIDSNKEANKVLVEELEGTLITVAKDCKLQVEFNPTEVASYRLLGYTNRILAAEDFNDDTKDAGEIGAGHTIVALYEIRPARNGDGQPLVDPLKYQKQVAPTQVGAPGELATLKVRYKLPDQDDSRVRILTVMDEGKSYGDASTDFKLSSSVALFGMILSRSQYVGQTSLDTAFELSLGSFGAENDPGGLRKELSGLIQAAKIIARQTQRK